jgi:hypothetical protein
MSMISLCLVDVLLFGCSVVLLLSRAPALSHPRLAVVVLEATHPIPPQYVANTFIKLSVIIKGDYHESYIITI